MRCGCPSCGTYMIQSEGLQLGCVCPECGYRCKQCLGTNTVVSREDLKKCAEEYMKHFGKVASNDDGKHSP